MNPIPRRSFLSRLMALPVALGIVHRAVAGATTDARTAVVCG